MSKGQRTKDDEQKVCLTIAGVDPSGGAGVYADIKTFSAFGCFATAAITSITFQNTQGVFGAEHQTAPTVRKQIEPVLDDFEIAALKTGMLPTREVIEETAAIIEKNNLKNLVVDPVVRSTSGFDLITDAALKALIEKLFPLADVITPNIPETERISGIKIKTEDDIRQAAEIMRRKGAKNVLIKGGHLEISDSKVQISDSEFSEKDKVQSSKTEDQRPKTENRTAKDYLFIGDELKIFEAEYFETTSTHGTGCTLAAAIAANLALGKDLTEAVGVAKMFVNKAIKNSPHIGKGNSPVGVGGWQLQ